MSFRMSRGRWTGAVIVVAAVLLAAHILSQRSEFCGSCHSAMGEHYESWTSSSHGELAECLDCHSDPGWAGYYHSKVDGVRNALSYYLGVDRGTTSHPPGPAACMRPGCHVADDLTADSGLGSRAHGLHVSRLGCVECHGDVGHRPAEREVAVDCSECHGTGADR